MKYIKEYKNIKWEEWDEEDEPQREKTYPMIPDALFVEFLIDNNIIDEYLKEFNKTDWYNDIDEFIRNMDRIDYIGEAFRWGSTKNGIDYWADINDRWIDLVDNRIDNNNESFDIKWDFEDEDEDNIPHSINSLDNGRYFFKAYRDQPKSYYDNILKDHPGFNLFRRFTNLINVTPSFYISINNRSTKPIYGWMPDGRKEGGYYSNGTDNGFDYYIKDGCKYIGEYPKITNESIDWNFEPILENIKWEFDEEDEVNSPITINIGDRFKYSSFSKEIIYWDNNRWASTHAFFDGKITDIKHSSDVKGNPKGDFQNSFVPISDDCYVFALSGGYWPWFKYISYIDDYIVHNESIEWEFDEEDYDEPDIDLSKPMMVKDLYLKLGGIDELLNWLNDNLLNKHLIIEDIDPRGNKRIISDSVVNKFNSLIPSKTDESLMKDIGRNNNTDIFTINTRVDKNYGILLHDVMTVKIDEKFGWTQSR